MMRSARAIAVAVHRSVTRCRTALAGALAIGLLLTLTFPAFADPTPNDPLEWRVLLIIKPEIDLTLKDRPTIRSRMPDDNVKAVQKAFVEHTPYWIDKISEGRLRWKPTAVVSSRPVTAAAHQGGDNYWLAPWNIEEDVKEFVPRGDYDGIFVYWKAFDEEGHRIDPGFGWSIGPNEAANGCGYSCVHYAGTDQWTRDSEITEVFVHEWLHQLEAFYQGKGIKLPKGGLHVDASYGYKHHPTTHWKPWYHDFIAGSVREPDGSLTGLGEKAWTLGTIREEQQIYLPEYLTPARREKNLLKDGSFESPKAPAWSANSWRGNKTVGRIVRDGPREGRQLATLDSDQADDASFQQKVAVQPHTRYLLSGWSRTKKVTITEKGGQVGANLSILGGYERSSTTLTGSKDWTYLTLVFDSGDRTSVQVAARLGHHGSTASGQAWFDDLCLIELDSKAASNRP
jgi:hypothetical protein